MPTVNEARDIGKQIAAYIKAIDEEIPFLSQPGVEAKDVGNFITAMGHTYITTMCHDHWVEEHTTVLQDELKEFMRMHRGEE